MYQTIIKFSSSSRISKAGTYAGFAIVLASRIDFCLKIRSDDGFGLCSYQRTMLNSKKVRSATVGF